MEKVFLRLSKVMEKDKVKSQETRLVENNDFSQSVDDDVNIFGGVTEGSQYHMVDSDKHILTGTALLFHRIKAFFIKRIIYSVRKWPLLITQGLLPVGVTIICLLVDGNVDLLSAQEPSLPLTPSVYDKTFSYVNSEENLKDIGYQYTSLFDHNHKVNETENVTISLMQAAEDSLSTYREQHVFSASFLERSDHVAFKVWTQTIPIHALGIGTSLVTNALIRHATNSSDYSITTNNYPLPPNTMWQFTSEFSASSVIYPSMMSLALAFLSASYLVFPLQERESNSKQVQVMTGAPLWALWTTNLAWDLATYVVTTVLILITFLALDPRGYFTMDEAFGALVLLLLVYGWSSIPLAYLFSFPFHTAAAGFAALTFVCIVAGELIIAIVAGLRLAETHSLDLASNIIHWITSLIPAYPVADGFRKIVKTSMHNMKCDKFDAESMNTLCIALLDVQPDSDFLQCCLSPPFKPLCTLSETGECFEIQSYFALSGSGLGFTFLSLFTDGVIFLALIAFIEAGIGRKILQLWRSVSIFSSPVMLESTEDAALDDDVTAETYLVSSLMHEGEGMVKRTEDSRDNTLLVHKLTKRYPGSIVQAVNNINFRVCRGECLGLLGINGAGKTTTFKMLTGDEMVTAGDAKIGNLSLTHHKREFLQQIGYCPQFDALMGDLTGIEMLELMGRLRGMNESHLKKTVLSLVDHVGLTECAQRPSSTYSGGNKRKLSTAMALIGEPALVFLDEPTSGVDPASRRRVWAAINKAVTGGQSVLLTSHSMEECEALCSRIIIMSRGTLRCVGTSSHIKAKFGQGYSLQVKLRTHGFNNTSNEDDHIYNMMLMKLKGLIHQHLPGSALVDQHKGMLAYRVPSTVTWGTLFAVMEALKAGREPLSHNTEASPSSSPLTIVEDYAASDTSLEQVFLSFAREAAHQEVKANVISSNVPTSIVTEL